MKEIEIRPAQADDFAAMHAIFEAVTAAGETYPFDSGYDADWVRDYWFGEGIASFVAMRGPERLLGMYRLARNQPDRGAHVANASYMVSPDAQGVGIGTMLGTHSIGEARRLGYLAMQFNYVISTNVSAVSLWKKLGFDIVGTLPGAFRHKRFGYVDAHVMYRMLEDPSNWPEPAE